MTWPNHRCRPRRWTARRKRATSAADRRGGGLLDPGPRHRVARLRDALAVEVGMDRVDLAPPHVDPVRTLVAVRLARGGLGVVDPLDRDPRAPRPAGGAYPPDGEAQAREEAVEAL